MQHNIYSEKEGKYDRELAILKSWNASERNKELIRAWHDYLFARGAGETRVTKVSSQLRKIVLYLDMDLDKVTRKDIQSVVGRFNRESSWSEATKADYKRCIKQFYLWYKDEDRRLKDGTDDALQFYKYIERNVKTRYKETRYDYSEILRDEDIRQVIDKGCRTVREKGFIAVLHEAGCRIGEMLNLKVKDVEFKDHCVILKVDGKTGVRRVPLVKCMGYLARWMDQHRFKDEMQAPLWINEGRKDCIPLKYVGATKLLSRCFERAGVKRRHNPHWFRHSRATLNAAKMTEAMMCKFFGWTMGSDQVRTYVHCNAGQVEDAVLNMYGVKKEEKEETVQQCACGMMNEHTAKYCHKCGKPLNVSVVMEDEDKKSLAIEEAFELLQRIMKDSKLRQRFERYHVEG